MLQNQLYSFYIFQAFNVMAQPIKQMKSAHYKSVSQVLDVNNVDVSIYLWPEWLVTK